MNTTKEYGKKLMMQKNLLVGNGINIQFGGYDNYSNEAVIKRVIENIKSGKTSSYLPACSKDDLLETFQKIKNMLVNIKNSKPAGNNLFLQMEVERISKQYKSDTPIEKIGIEDFFIPIEYVKEETDTEEFLREAHREFQMLFLDAIYDDGKINDIDYGSKIGDFLSTYDNVFTINYDSNLDKYRNDIKHLHGRFEQLAPEYDSESEYCKNNPDQCKAATMTSDFDHVYSNTIMSWSWLEKYGEWLGKEEMYGTDFFNKVCGKLHIVGMSPCNDEHLFLMISTSGLTSVDYYYHSADDRSRMKDKIKKPITYRNIKKLWDRLA